MSFGFEIEAEGTKWSRFFDIITGVVRIRIAKTPRMDICVGVMGLTSSSEVLFRSGSRWSFNIWTY